jgi:hypothetical protein
MYNQADVDRLMLAARDDERKRCIEIVKKVPANESTGAATIRAAVVRLENGGVETEPGHLNKLDPREATLADVAQVLNETVDAVEELRKAWSRRHEP